MNALSLNQVCYEQIAEEYWYGKFGEFKLIINRNTGCFNATKLCQQGGKMFKNWLKNKDSKELIQYYKNKSTSSNNSTCVFEVKLGSSKKYPIIVAGTYVPKEFILSLALWISKPFYDKVLSIVESYYINEYIEKYKHNKEKLQAELQRMSLEMERNAVENERINRQLEIENERMRLHMEGVELEKDILQRHNNTYKNFEEDIAFKTSDRGKLNMLAIMKTNDESCEYPLRVIRTQRRNFAGRRRKLKKSFPKLQILWMIEYNPNAVKSWNRVKEQLKKINFKQGMAKLVTGYTEEEFIRDVEAITKPNIMLGHIFEKNT